MTRFVSILAASLVFSTLFFSTFRSQQASAQTKVTPAPAVQPPPTPAPPPAHPQVPTPVIVSSFPPSCTNTTTVGPAACTTKFTCNNGLILTVTGTAYRLCPYNVTYNTATSAASTGSTQGVAYANSTAILGPGATVLIQVQYWTESCTGASTTQTVINLPCPAASCPVTE